MTFRVGQKVVCVDAASTGKYMPPGFHHQGGDSMHGLQVGTVYTIRELGARSDVLVCRLMEITRDYEPFFDEEAWFARARFRPVVETKTDISIFKKMLQPKREDA